MTPDGDRESGRASARLPSGALTRASCELEPAR